MASGRPIIAMALLAALAGCTTTSGGSSEDRLGRMVVAPGKFVLYTCPELAAQATVTVARIRELERLMAKANVDPSGRFVSVIAYRPEYIEMRGELNELHNAAASKNCKSIAGLDAPGGRTSDGAVR